MQIQHKSLISKFSPESVGAVVGHALHVWSVRLFISMPRGGEKGYNAHESTCTLTHNRYTHIYGSTHTYSHFCSIKPHLPKLAQELDLSINVINSSSGPEVSVIRQGIWLLRYSTLCKD